MLLLLKMTEFNSNKSTITLDELFQMNNEEATQIQNEYYEEHILEDEVDDVAYFSEREKNRRREQEEYWEFTKKYEIFINIFKSTFEATVEELQQIVDDLAPALEVKKNTLLNLTIWRKQYAKQRLENQEVVAATTIQTKKIAQINAEWIKYYLM